MDKFLIIDGNSIAYRAAVACDPTKDLKNSQGKVTGGAFRFINLLNKTLELAKPTHVIVCFDTSRQTFRHNLFAEYKANRLNRNEDVYVQFNDIKKILELIGIKHDNILGYEGDDLVGTYKNMSKSDKNFILSGDKDIFQLIDDNTFVIFPMVGMSEVKVYNKDRFKERFNIDVEKYIDFKCLLGDSGDNIPGVNGCGDKTASKILNKYGDIQTTLQHLDDENKDIRSWKKISNTIKEWSPTYPLMKQLVTIKQNVDVKYSFDDCKIKLDWKNAISFLEELEFTSTIKRIREGKLYR